MAKEVPATTVAGGDIKVFFSVFFFLVSQITAAVQRSCLLAGGPRILGTRTSVSVKRGSPARLTCPVSGRPIPKIRWLRNGREVKVKKG